MMGYMIKRNLALYVMAVLASIVILDFFVTVPVINTMSQHLVKWATTLASFAIVVGLVSFIRYHYTQVRKQEHDYWLNVWSILIATVMILLGLTLGPSSANYTWIWYMFNSWPYRVVTVLNALFIMSAAFRAFKIRSVETAILMAGGFLTLLGMAPMIAKGGGVLPAIALWLTTIAQSQLLVVSLSELV